MIPRALRTTPVYSEPSTSHDPADLLCSLDELNPMTIVVISHECDPTSRYLAGHIRDQGLRAVEIWHSDLEENGHALISRVLGSECPIFLRTSGVKKEHLCTFMAFDQLTRHTGRILNSPANRSLNFSKPLQAARLGECTESRYPHTQIRNNFTATANSTIQACIVKSLSAFRSEVSLYREVHRMLRPGRDSHPLLLQFQEYLQGTQYRVHVVGDVTVAVRVCTGLLDYRHDDEVTFEFCELPLTVVNMAKAMANAEGLAFAGVDLVQVGGEYFCFEINPEPGYHFYERISEDKPISDCVIRYLIGKT